MIQVDLLLTLVNHGRVAVLCTVPGVLGASTNLRYLWHSLSEVWYSFKYHNMYDDSMPLASVAGA